VIAKIEKPEAVQNLGAILQACDGVMVARGDLGVEFGHEKVPLLQKRILREIQPLAKPAITATQMLDSMVHNPRPTRAEVSDVANAVLDGTDAVMLSAETSVGAWPVEAVRTLARIIEEIEQEGQALAPRQRPPLEHTFPNAIANAAAEVAENLALAAIAVYTETGHTAALVSAHRPKASVVALSRHEAVLQKLALSWGVLPVHGDWVKGVDGVVAQTERILLERRLARPGDNVAITFGMVLRGEPFQTDVLKLWKIAQP
jgi:pyruvate kinase